MMMMDGHMMHEQMCGGVDEETECLSRRGWTRHGDLTTLDEIYAFDTRSCAGYWSPLRTIHRREYSGPMIRWTAPGFDGLTVPDHRWLVTSDARKSEKFRRAGTVSYGPRPSSRQFSVVKTCDLRKSHIIPTNAGSRQRAREIGAKFLFSLVQTPSLGILTQLSQEQAVAMLAMLRLTIGGSSPWEWGKWTAQDGEQAANIQILAALAGIPCRLFGATLTRGSDAGIKIRSANGHRAQIEHRGIVWNPELGAAPGVWLARRNGTLYFTYGSSEPDNLGRQPRILRDRPDLSDKDRA